MKYILIILTNQSNNLLHIDKYSYYIFSDNKDILFNINNIEKLHDDNDNYAVS